MAIHRAACFSVYITHDNIATMGVKRVAGWLHSDTQGGMFLCVYYVLQYTHNGGGGGGG